MRHKLPIELPGGEHGCCCLRDVLHLPRLKITHFFHHRNQLEERIQINGCGSAAVNCSNMGQRLKNTREPRGLGVPLNFCSYLWSLNVVLEKEAEYYAEGKGHRKQQGSPNLWAMKSKRRKTHERRYLWQQERTLPGCFGACGSCWWANSHQGVEVWRSGPPTCMRSLNIRLPVFSANEAVPLVTDTDGTRGGYYA